MSAHLVILPQIWATAAVSGRGMDVSQKKGPHRLRLVRACAGGEQEKALASVEQVDPTGDAVTRKERGGLAFYRKYTEALLRKYLKMSLEGGRVQSLLGRELFRGHVSSYQVQSFDDVVIFVHDVENCLGKLDSGERHLIRRIALEEYSQGEAAALLGIPLRTVLRHYGEALDRLTRMFLERKMLEPLAEVLEDASKPVAVVKEERVAWLRPELVREVAHG